MSECPYYALEIFKIWWKLISDHIRWWDEFEWQKWVPGVMDDARHPPKNATVKNFTSTEFLGPIKFDSPNGGTTSNSRIKKKWTLPLKKWWTRKIEFHAKICSFGLTNGRAKSSIKLLHSQKSCSISPITIMKLIFRGFYRENDLFWAPIWYEWSFWGRPYRKNGFKLYDNLLTKLDNYFLIHYGFVNRKLC